jgi:erythronate-4-phosphate dehydrogenase
MKIVCDDKIPYLKGVLEPFCNDVVYISGAKISPTDVKDADALIVRTRTKCDKALLEGSKIKFIATATIGYDHIDIEYCNSHSIKWTNAPGCNSGSVNQYIGSVLAFLTGKYELDPEELTIGVVGVGNVGAKVANLAEKMGFNVLLNDPPREINERSDIFVSLDEIIKKADIITFHVPLIEKGDYKTLHLANEDFFEQVSSNQILIKSSRGEVVDNHALKQALIKKRIKTAVLDVWENEPEIDLELLKLVSIGTPHIAGYSRDGKANGTAMSVNSLSEFFNLPLNNWYPEDIEIPENFLFEIPEELNGFEAQRYAIRHTYKVENDSKALKKNPSDFERLRGDYPVRREFEVFRVKNNESSLITGLGFR